MEGELPSAPAFSLSTVVALNNHVDHPLTAQVVRSNTDCEGASEPEASAGKTQRPGKKTPPSPDVIIEDQYSDQEEMVKRVENVSLNAKGTGLLFARESLDVLDREGSDVLSRVVMIFFCHYDLQGEKV